jgi:hypothetical protein
MHRVCRIGLQLKHPFVRVPAQDRRGETSQRPRSVRGSVHVREEERMSFVSPQPEALAAAAGILPGIGLSMRAENAAAAAAKTGSVPDAANATAAG